MNFLQIIIVLSILIAYIFAQQCTSSNYERCICTTSVPYCGCTALTTTNTLNFSTAYNSHLIAVTDQGCRPCSSTCLKCVSQTSCSQCLSSFQLTSGNCKACPVNCQTCLNGVCSTCINGYYLDYQTNCQSCSISGASICTINSLISCLSNYWLDNNAANCIMCDLNCFQCTSTTKCGTCNIGYFLRGNYTCQACKLSCYSCSDSLSCSICANSSLYYNSTLNSCVAGSASNCINYLNSAKCQQCNQISYLSSSNLCVQMNTTQIISNCSFHVLINNSISCKNCTVGFFNQTNGCFYGCSNLCTSCYGPHYGLCYGCIRSAYLMNYHCIPIYNLNGGAAYQLYYTASHNPSFFTGQIVTNNCLFETLSTGLFVEFDLNNLQSYQVTLMWKVYIYNLPTNVLSPNYRLVLNNSMNNFQQNFEVGYCTTNCNNSIICIDKKTKNISSILLNNNTITFSCIDCTIGVSEILIIAYRCGGIQGSQCLECSSTSQCTKCVNPSYYISGYTCVPSCPKTYFIRVSSRTCLQTCPSGTYAINILQQCFQCIGSCLTCTSNTTCLSCISGTYLFNSSCQQCPSGYFGNNFTRTCSQCLRPCLTCTSNLKCLSCIYGFYQNATNSCVLSCGLGFFGNLNTITCQNCISPCKTCNPYVGSQCRSCINGTYLMNSQCLLSCPSGFFHQKESCNVCSPICASCDIISSNCTECVLGTYLFNFTCISNCPATFYVEIANNSCRSCPKLCLSCTNSMLCQSCLNGSSYFSQNYSCLNNCPSLFYSVSNICYSCQLPCKTCLSLSQCLSCQALFFFNFSCLSSCPSGTFASTMFMSCVPCNPLKCLQCFNSNDYCTRCNSSLILFENSCISRCPIGYYFQSLNNICLTCKQQCPTCLNFTYCLSCYDNYIIQNGNCIAQCNTGYYKTNINSSTSCLNCPSNCSSCAFNAQRNEVQCLTCIAGLIFFNQTCIVYCPITYFAKSGICFQCILPCQTCNGQNSCLSCMPLFGYLLNNSCLNSCPSGYFENISSYQCSQCSLNCYSCIFNASNCVFCNKGYFLQNNDCLSSCLPGYYSLSSSPTCYKCSSICGSCSNTPTNCTSCSNQNYILIGSGCFLSCNSGSYLSQGQCYTCPQNCSICVNSTYCNQCKQNYYLSPSYLCTNTCPSLYFPLNGICKTCVYPCKTCLTISVCQTCLSGFFYLGDCYTVCPISTYVNSSTFNCDRCPSNCINCKSQSNCLQCISGVLVNGSCLKSCPQGYYDYYSICAPCMYGCLNCSNSSTCNYCFIGFLFSGVCLEHCPTGWVSTYNSKQSHPVCQKCVNGCLKCSVKPQQCILCSNGLFLYIFSCVSICPPGTYNNYQTSSCLTCKLPCETCDNGYSCKSCIYGYILYSQPSGNQCISGTSCPNSFYHDLQNNICVYKCSNGTYVQPIHQTCSNPCPQSFVLLKQNFTCQLYCPENMWINDDLVCLPSPAPIQLPIFTCNSFILRNLFIIDCIFNMEISNIQSLNLQSFTINNFTIAQIYIMSDTLVRFVVIAQVDTLRSSNVVVALSTNYQLYANIPSNNLQSYQTSQRRLQQYLLIPVQNTNFSIFVNQFVSYSNEQRQTGMQLLQIAESICIGAFIFWLFSLLMNLKSTSLTFICLLQWIYSLSLNDITFAPNLGQFIEGFKSSNLIFSSSPINDEKIWKINSSYRAGLWGIVDLFNFEAIFLPSIIVIFFFLAFFLSTYLVYRRYQKAQPKTEEKKGQQQNNNESIERPESSIFTDKVSLHPDDKQPSNLSKSQKQKSGKTQKQKSKSLIERQQNKQFKQDQQAQQKPWCFIDRQKLSHKCKIIHERFYYNYWLQCILITASPLSIAICCQLISPNPLSLVFTFLFAVASVVILILFFKHLSRQEKMFVTTKYWAITYIETLLQNGLAILSTVQMYIGIMSLIFIINIYVWNRIFSSKRSNQLKHFFQINDTFRLVLLIEALIGYTNQGKWNGTTCYYYSWIFIVTLIVMIVFAVIQSTKQFFDHEEGTKKEEKHTKTNIGGREDSQSQSIKSESRKSSKQQLKGEQGEQAQDEEQQAFFSVHQGQLLQPDSDDDIIDFDEINLRQNGTSLRAPQKLIRYEKNDKSS